MEHKEEIPCVTCKAWSEKHKKFFCTPKECRTIDTWLTIHIPKLSNQAIWMVDLPETAKQYVV